MTTRAVSNPVGVILILGMTILSVGALVAVGGAVIDDTRADAERSQMENSMSAFSSKASLVGLGESGHQRFSLGRVSQGRVDVREDAGRVHVKIQRNGTNETVKQTSIGAVVYENDGREIAYQGGGVWARQGDFSRMLSPPEFHYRAETLTFPIINVTGDGAASGDVRGTVSSDEEPQQWYPDDSEDDFNNPLTNGTVYVEIESEYCRGWQSFFDSRTQGGIEESCESGNDGTVVVDLTVPLDPTFGTAVTAGRFTDDGADIESFRDGVFAPSASGLIDNQIDSCLTNGCTGFASGETLDSGTYYTEDASTFEGLTLDTSDGDVNVIVNDPDGGVDGPGSIDVTGDGTASVYLKTDDDFSMTGGSDKINSGGEPEQFIMYVHSDVSAIKINAAEYVGGIYAPRTNLEGDQGNGNGCGGGNADVVGAIVVENFCFKNGNFDYDGDMSSLEIDLSIDTVKYLHVSENTIEVDI
jgi:hypothetical protein